MSEITKIELNFTLEGEDAVAVLRAILGAKAEVKSDVATKAVSPVEPKKTEVPEKKQDKRKKKGAGSRFLIAPWSDSGWIIFLRCRRITTTRTKSLRSDSRTESPLSKSLSLSPGPSEA